MGAGTCGNLSELPPAARDLVDEAGRAVLTTLDRSGGPHAVPVCFAISAGEVVTAIDHKPKSTRSVARLDNVGRDARVAVLFDRYDERWERLGWVMVRGSGRIEEPGWGVDALAARYPQYAHRPPEGEVIVVTPRRVNWWLWDESK